MRKDLLRKSNQIVEIVERQKGRGLVDVDSVYWFLFRYCKYHGVGVKNIEIKVRFNRVEIDELNALYFRKNAIVPERWNDDGADYWENRILARQETD